MSSCKWTVNNQRLLLHCLCTIRSIMLLQLNCAFHAVCHWNHDTKPFCIQVEIVSCCLRPSTSVKYLCQRDQHLWYSQLQLIIYSKVLFIMTVLVIKNAFVSNGPYTEVPLQSKCSGWSRSLSFPQQECPYVECLSIEKWLHASNNEQPT